MPFCATTMCVLIIGSMVATNAVVVKAAGLQILSAVTVSLHFTMLPKTITHKALDS